MFSLGFTLGFTLVFLLSYMASVISWKINYRHPDIGLSVIQMIKKYGYPIERHLVETEDGYILEMHRIPHGINNKNQTGKAPVLLVHGIVSSSADWVVLGPEKALPYILADEGYDVWMANVRGNTWSRKHKTLDPDKDKQLFWNFSWHEIGCYDLPTMIDYALYVNGADQLYYIGYSQGVTVFFVLLSEKPEYNDKIRLMNALAPPVFIKHATSPLLRFLTSIQDEFELITESLGMYEFPPYGELIKVIGSRSCPFSIPSELCSNILFLIAGFDKQQLNKTILPVILTNLPAGSSTRQFIHFFQIIKSGLFRQFDFHFPTKNLEYYGQTVPPEYNLKYATVPVALHYGNNDWLVPVEGVLRLRDKLPNVVADHLIRFEKFNHLDFVWANDVRELLYKYVVELIKQY